MQQHTTQSTVKDDGDPQRTPEELEGFDAGREEGSESSASIAPAPDGGYGWIIVAACFVLQGMLDGTFSIVGVFLPEFVDYFDGGRGQVAVIGSVMGGCVMLSGPFVSILVNCWGCRPVTVCGGVVIVVGMLASTLAPSVNFIVGTLGFVTGIGLGMTFLPSMVIVGFYFERRRAVATGIATSGAGVGVLIMAPLAAFFLQHYDWKNALVLLAGILLNSVVAGALLRPLGNPGPSRSVSSDSGSDNRQIIQSEPKSGNDAKMSHTLLKAALLNSTASSKKEHLINGVSKHPNSNTVDKPYALRNGPRDRTISSSESVDRYKRVDGKECDVYKSRGHNSHVHNGLHVENNENNHYYSNYEISDGFAGESLLKHRQHRQHWPSAKDSPLIRRKDVFYTGSVTHLAEFRSQPDMKHYISSVTIPVDETEENSSPDRCCSCIPTRNLTTTKRMLDFSLFTNCSLIVIAASNAMWQAGYMIPLMFITDYGISKGMDSQLSSLFVSVFGVSMIFGRALGGAIGNLPRINPLCVVLAAQVLAGLASIAVPFCSSFITVMFFLATIGFMLGPITPLTTVCLVDYLGLNKLTNAVGLVSLSKGIFCFFGAPIAGVLLDATGSYAAPFVFAGALYICCGLSFVLLPLVGKRHN